MIKKITGLQIVNDHKNTNAAIAINTEKKAVFLCAFLPNWNVDYRVKLLATYTAQ